MQLTVRESPALVKPIFVMATVISPADCTVTELISILITSSL